jgi:hypothetical protein
MYPEGNTASPVPRVFRPELSQLAAGYVTGYSDSAGFAGFAGDEDCQVVTFLGVV